MGGIYEFKDFRATQNTTGDDRRLHITGTITFRSGGWKARLERDSSGPIPISPHSPKFLIVLTPPPGGVATDALTDVSVEYHEEHASHQYYEALLRLRNEDGSEPTDEPEPPRLRVEHPDAQ
jgi:hypothetical protein